MKKFYENAAHELRTAGLTLAQQYGTTVRYDGIIVGGYAVDLPVERSVLVELEAVRALDQIHRAQCLNHLKATGLRICLLIKFGLPRVAIGRIVQNL